MYEYNYEYTCEAILCSNFKALHNVHVCSAPCISASPGVLEEHSSSLIPNHTAVDAWEVHVAREGQVTFCTDTCKEALQMTHALCPVVCCVTTSILYTELLARTIQTPSLPAALPIFTSSMENGNLSASPSHSILTSWPHGSAKLLRLTDIVQ